MFFFGRDTKLNTKVMLNPENSEILTINHGV